MNMLLYIACCMSIAFIVGLAMGMRVGYITGLEQADEQVRAMAARYNALRTEQLRERALKVKASVTNGR